MKRLEGLEVRARQLLTQGSLSRSQCGATLLAMLKPLMDGGVLEWERDGAGQRLCVRSADAARAFLLQRFPELERALESSEISHARVEGVARYRDSKSLGNDTPEIVCMRIWNDACLSLWEKPTAASLLTSQHGVFSFVLGVNSPYALHGACALVENPAVFGRFEHLGAEAGLVIQGRGRISDRLLEWLSQQAEPGFRLRHFPDYDPVGMDEYLRLKGRLGERVSLHCPTTLPALFARYSKPQLLLNPHSQALLSRLRSTEDPAVQHVVGLMDLNNGGLEQESLLLP